GERLRYYLSRVNKWPTDLDMQFMTANDDLKRCLAEYIRSHRTAFAHLDSPRAKRPPKKPSKPVEEPPKRRPKPVPTLGDRPRWERIAFGARCARQVNPLLVRHWPKIPPNRAKAVRLAIDLTEQSAEEGRAVEGLKEAVLQALVTAGAALRGHEAGSGPENA